MTWLKRLRDLSTFSLLNADVPEFRRELETLLHVRLKALGMLAIIGMGLLGASEQWALHAHRFLLGTAASALCASLDLWGA